MPKYIPPRTMMRDKPQVLVIDDEKDICNLFEEALTPEGYEVFTALDGESGLKIIGEKKPDIVLLDLKLPKMNGIEVLRRIKRIDKNIVVIIITAYGTMDTARMAMKIGSYDYITKPFDLNYVKAVIKDGLKMGFAAFADKMKEKEVLRGLRLQRAQLANLKHCQGTQVCFWEVALRAFVLGDDSFMAEWMENPKTSKEEKLGLTQIAQLLKAEMTGKTGA